MTDRLTHEEALMLRIVIELDGATKNEIIRIFDAAIAKYGTAREAARNFNMKDFAQ